MGGYVFLNVDSSSTCQVDGDLLTTAKFVDALKIPYIAPSFGGCESIVDQPAIMSYWYGIFTMLVGFEFICFLRPCVGKFKIGILGKIIVTLNT